MEMKRIVLDSELKEFKESVLAFVAKNSWTISNVNDAMYEVKEHLENNAILHEVLISSDEIKNGCENDEVGNQNQFTF